MDINAIVKWENCCRLCLLDDGIKLPIFEGEGVQRQVARKIQTCFPILIYIGDPLPKMICHKCLYKLDTVYDFRHKCLEANAVLKNRLSALRHIPEVKHYLSKLGKQEARLEGLPYAQTLGQDPVIRRKDGGVHSTNAQSKNVAGNMFQGIFIADCSSEVFLPEHSVDTRQRSVPACSSRSTESEVISKHLTRTPASGMPPVLSVSVSNQSSRGNNENKTLSTVTSPDIGALKIKQEPPDEESVSNVPSAQTKVMQQNAMSLMTTSTRTSWSTLTPPPPPPPPPPLPLSNVSYPVTSLSIKSLMSLQPPTPLQSQIPIQPLTPQMCQPSLKSQHPSHYTNSLTQSSIIPSHPSAVPLLPRSSFITPQPSIIPPDPSAIPLKSSSLSPQLSSLPPRFSAKPKPSTVPSTSPGIPLQPSTLLPRLSTIPPQLPIVSPKPIAVPSQSSTILPRLLTMPPKLTAKPSQSSIISPQSTTIPQQSSVLQTEPSIVYSQPSPLQLQPSTLQPQPSTLHRQPSPLQLQPSTLHQKPSPLQLQPSTLQPQPSTLHRQPSSLQLQPSILQPQTSTLHRQQPSSLQLQPSILQPQPLTLHRQQPSSLQLQPSILEPQPSTLHQQPSSLQLQPSTLQPQQPSTLHRQPSSLQLQPSILQPQLLTVQQFSTLSQPSIIPPKSSILSPQSLTISSQPSTAPPPPPPPPPPSLPPLSPPSTTTQPSNILYDTFSSPPKARFLKQRGISPWNCEYCNKYYKSRDTLHKHRKYFCPNKSTCSKCGGVFSNAVELAIHQKSHLRVNISLPEESLLVCTVCNKKFAARSMLHMHKKMHEKMKELQNNTSHPEKQFQCPHCPRAYIKKFNLQVHMRVHMISEENALESSQSETKPMIAGYSGGDELSNMNIGNEAGEKTIPQWKQKCSCKYCGHICTDSNALWMHMVQQHSSDQAFRCDKCGKEFNQQQVYLAHKKTMCVKVRCKICGKLYASPKALREHEWNKHGVERATHHCRLCGQSFVTRSALLIHGRVHHVVKKGSVSPPPLEQQPENVQKPIEVVPLEENLNLPCKICFRVFTTHQALQRHIKIHATGKHVFYPCEICGKKFVSLEMYKTHAASHTVSQSFHCSHCNKIFFKEEVFRGHTCESISKQACMTCDMILTEEQRLNHVCREKAEDMLVPCKQCSAVFSSLKALSCHMRMHKRQKELLATDFKRSCIRMTNGLYKCNICGKLTTTQQGAAAHSRWHVGPTPNRPFKCPFCKRKYSSESGLYSHISVEHPESA